jgi:imidazolonepropionase-like amidohydrolase
MIKILYGMKKILYTVSIIFLLLAGCSTAEEAELVIRNGKVLTVDEYFSVEEAVAVLDGKILFTGSNRDIEKYIGPGTELIDADGLTVLPRAY